MNQNTADLYALAWPLDRLGEALEHVARKANLAPQAMATVPAPPNLPHEDALSRWVDIAVDRLGIEAEPVQVAFSEVAVMVQNAAPAILRLPPPDDQSPPLFLALLSNGNRRVAVLTPTLKVRRVRVDLVRAALCASLVEPWKAPVAQILEEVGIAEERRDRVLVTLIEEQFRAQTLDGGWLLRLSPGSELGRQATNAGVWRHLWSVIGASLAQQAVMLLAWWVIGRGLFGGGFDWAWLLAWALLLLTAIPFQLWANWASSEFAIGMGTLFKQRLLLGALKLEPDETRHQGRGQFLGRVMESEAVELLAVGGGLMTLVALIQLLAAGWVLSRGASGWLLVAVLAAWIGVTLVLGWIDYRSSRAWVRAYRQMTNDLVERMIGHRTRLAQKNPRNWHAGEDRELARYIELSRQLDKTDVWLAALPNTWLVAGLVSIAYSFVTSPQTSAAMAVSLGGIMLAYQALTVVMGGMQSVVQLAIAWEQVAPVFEAAARPSETQIAPIIVTGEHAGSPEQPLLLAKGLNFRYREHGRLALDECGLKVYPHDRLLLEGPSGGGKTTLAAVLSGLRSPESGVLLLRGYDQQSIGREAWRRLIAVVPQFHENHVFTETFGFNLLMGRRWPPSAQDLHEAEVLCHALGLGDLLARMPSGLQQIVGESGWQLSHGERSRMFIARALLQRADLVIVDESFGTLDPESLRRALQCTLERAPTLLVIAHP